MQRYFRFNFLFPFSVFILIIFFYIRFDTHKSRSLLLVLRPVLSLIPATVKVLTPVSPWLPPCVCVYYRAGGSSIIVCREIWPSQIGNCRQHCAAVLENALEKAVRGPPPASTSKFDFPYSTLSRRQTKEVTRVVGVWRINWGIKNKRERKGWK